MENSIHDLIRQAELEIQRDSEDIARLLKRYPGYDFVLVRNRPSNAPPISEESRIGGKKLTNLESSVLSIVDSDATVEWTSRSVREALGSSGLYKLPQADDAAMNAVSGALISLKNANRIVRVHEGRGRNPHRYVSMSTKEKEATEVTSS